MRRSWGLGWALLAAAAVTVAPVASHAKSKKSTEDTTASTDDGAASDPELEQRVEALEKKLDMQQQTTTTDEKTVGDRIDSIEKQVKDTEKTLADKLGIAVHGLVAVDYLYDINRPDGHAAPFLRSFENDSNGFILNQANLHFERQPDSGLGFVSDLNFGKTADVVNNTTHFSGAPTSLGNGTDFIDVTQFYLTYTIPVGSGIKLKAGRFVTLAGEEVIKAYNNQNYNVTNSILFGFAIPFTHTGLMASYAFSDQFAIDLGLVNGWDNVSDSNDGKTIHSGITIAPDPKFTLYITNTYGPEEPNNGRSKRYLATVLATIKATDQLTFIVDYDYGNESNIELASNTVVTTDPLTGQPVGGNKYWQGIATYAVFAPTDSLSFAFRGEVFDDPDGVRTLVQEPGFGPGATYWEITPTVTYKIADGLFWRNEFRHDESDKRVFPHESSFERGQDTLASELLFTF